MKTQLSSILLALILAAMTANAQTPHESTPRWSLGLAGGLAIPVGPFAGIQTMNGHATTQPGAAAEFSVGFNFSRYFSVILAAGEQFNKGDGIPFTPTPYRYPANVAYKDRYWKISRLLGGGTLNLPLQKNGHLTLFIRGLAGIQKTRAADVYKSVKVDPSIPGLLYDIYPVTYPGPSFSWTFAWEADAGLNWKWQKRWAFVAYTGISGASPAKNLPYLLGGDEMITLRSVFPTTTAHVNGGIVYYLPY